MSSNDAKFETLMTTFTEASEFKLLLKNPCCDTPEKRLRVEQVITKLVAKGKVWKPQLKLTDGSGRRGKKGGLILPGAVYLEGLAALRDLLNEYETHPDAKRFDQQ